MKIFINSVLVPAYNYVGNGIMMTKKESFLGRISSNQGTLKLINNGEYTLSDYENKSIVVKDDDDNEILTGVTLKAKRDIDAANVSLPIRDKWYSIENTTCSNKTWKNTALKTIIEDVIGMTSETSYNVENPSLTATWFSVTEDEKVKNVLEELVGSVGGSCYYDSAGTLQVTAGFASSFSTTTQRTLTNSNSSRPIALAVIDRYDYADVKWSEKEFSDTETVIYDGASTTNPWVIPSAGIGVSDDYYVNASNKIHELSAYTTVSFAGGGGNLTLDQTVYDSNFQTSSQPYTDSKVKVKITNSAGTDQALARIKFKGKIITETSVTAAYQTGLNLLSYSSEVVSDATWAGKLAQWRYEESTSQETLEINLPDFVFTLDLRDKILYDSVRYVITGINLTPSTVKLMCKKDRTSAFSYDSGNVTQRYDRDEYGDDEDDNEFEISGDGSEPNSYGFIDSECSATVENNKRIARLSWGAYSTPSQDIKSFNIRYSNSSDDPQYTISKGSGTIAFDPANETEVTVDGDVFTTDIEIPTTDTYNFGLIVEDFDGYRRLYYNNTTPTNDGFISLGFSSATIPGGPVYAPGISSNSTQSNYMQIEVLPAATGTEKEWILQVQLAEITEEWGNDTYDFSGSEAYQWENSVSYYPRIYLEESQSSRVFKARVRFKDKNDNVSSWSTVVYDTVPIAYGSAPTTPTNLTSTQITEGARYFVKLACDEATDAEAYKWYVTYGTTLGSEIYFEVETTENEVYIELDGFRTVYNYVHVIATNSYGDSGRTYIASGW